MYEIKNLNLKGEKIILLNENKNILEKNEPYINLLNLLIFCSFYLLIIFEIT